MPVYPRQPNRGSRIACTRITSEEAVLFAELMIDARVPLVAIDVRARLVDPIYALARKGVVRFGIVVGDGCRGRIDHAGGNLLIAEGLPSIGSCNRIYRREPVVNKRAERLPGGVPNDLS